MPPSRGCWRSSPVAPYRLLREDDGGRRRRRRGGSEARGHREHPRTVHGPRAADEAAALALPQPPSVAYRRLESAILRQQAIYRPEPIHSRCRDGLKFNFIENGVFETGTTRTNPIEAKAVARAIVTHAAQYPKLSLGVAAFSAAQRRAIQDQVELLRRQLPVEHEAFFQAHPSEPFFIKNLENVQGDERDVIFISVGYGPTASGQKPPMRFGPLGVDGGERRLNVLISRAKRRCEVFSSMTDEDIDPDFASASSRKGVFAFKLFLQFARTGRMVMAKTTGRDHDSVFEEQVSKALRARGHTVHAQVGIAGFFIDLAVSDPALPGRYVLGIECDGESLQRFAFGQRPRPTAPSGARGPWLDHP